MCFYSRLNTLSGPTFRQMYFFGFVSKLERESSIVISKGEIFEQGWHIISLTV